MQYFSFNNNNNNNNKVCEISHHMQLPTGCDMLSVSQTKARPVQSATARVKLNHPSAHSQEPHWTAGVTCTLHNAIKGSQLVIKHTRSSTSMSSIVIILHIDLFWLSPDTFYSVFRRRLFHFLPGVFACFRETRYFFYSNVRTTDNWACSFRYWTLQRLDNNSNCSLLNSNGKSVLFLDLVACDVVTFKHRNLGSRNENECWLHQPWHSWH